MAGTTEDFRISRPHGGTQCTVCNYVEHFFCGFSYVAIVDYSLLRILYDAEVSGPLCLPCTLEDSNLYSRHFLPQGVAAAVTLSHNRFSVTSNIGY